MKNKSSSKISIHVFLVFSLFAFFLTWQFIQANDGTPVPPHNFYGTLHINGIPAPVGTEIKAMVDGEDRTYKHYLTEVDGQYGSLSLFGKFGVNCTLSEIVSFYVDTDGGFKYADQTAICDPGEDTELDLTVTYEGPSCTDNDGDSYAVEGGDCGLVDCDDSDADRFPGNPEVCDGKDNDCDTSIDEDLIQACGSGNCEGTQACTAGSWGDCSSSGSDCGTCCLCDSSGTETYDGTQNGDCSPTDCPSDVCGGNGCGPNILYDYPLLVPNECSALFTCTAYSCDDYATCENDDDADGYSPSCGDCDDADPDRNPEETEVCNDGVDNDCDGLVDGSDPDCGGSGFCIEITDMRLLDFDGIEIAEVTPGSMYQIEVSNMNVCPDPITSLQIVQIKEGYTPINIGTVKSTIQAGETNVITVGFILPADTTSGTSFVAEAYNWNHWASQPDWMALSLDDSLDFQAS